MGSEWEQYPGEDPRVSGENDQGEDRTGLNNTVQVCYERFRAQSEVHQCERGHFVCGNCRPRVEVREERDLYKTYLGIFQVCPTCRGRMMARCNGFETFLQSLMM